MKIDTAALAKAAKELIEESGFDPALNQDSNPRTNSDRLSASSALMVRLNKLVDDIPDVPLVREPLSVKRIKRLMDSDKVLTVAVVLEMNELTCGIDCVNDAVSERITGSTVGLEDISYEIIGAKDGDAVVMVSGKVENFLAEEENDEQGMAEAEGAE